MKLIKDKKVLLSVLGIVAGFPLWITGSRLMGEEPKILYAVCAIAGAALFFISLGYLVNHIIERRHLELMRKDSIDVNDESDTIVRDEAGARTHSLLKGTSQMKLNKNIIVLYVLGIIAGLALFVTPAILGGVESRILGFVCIYAGMGLFGLSLVFLEMYISKRKRPELLRKQKIEAKDERNTIIRDKAGARTFGYLCFMILISLLVFSWFDVELDYVQLIWWIMLISTTILYFAHIYYYKKRL